MLKSMRLEIRPCYRARLVVLAFALFLGGAAVGARAPTLPELRDEAQHGDPEAQYRLGLALKQGVGIRQDRVAAAKLFKAAAEQVQHAAEQEIAEAYAHGAGLPQDYEKARFWYLRSAQHGNSAGMFGLAELYRDGHAVESDSLTAYALFSAVRLAHGDLQGPAKREQARLRARLDAKEAHRGEELGRQLFTADDFQALLNGKDAYVGYGDMFLPNGAHYEGRTEHGKANGHGVLTLPDGTRYEGLFLEGVRDGQGVLTWPNGDRYEGGFAKGRFSGHGHMHRADGSSYEGDYVAGKEQGTGILITADGNRYEGEFLEGQRSGRGTLIYPDGRRVEGRFANDALVATPAVQYE